MERGDEPAPADKARKETMPNVTNTTPAGTEAGQGGTTPQGTATDEAQQPAGATDKGAPGAGGDKPSETSGSGKSYSQADVDEIVNSARETERKRLEKEASDKAARDKMTAEERIAASQRDLQDRDARLARQGHEIQLLKLNQTSATPVPPEYIDRALDAAIAAGGELDPAKVLTKAAEGFKSWCEANGFARQTATPGDAAGSGKPAIPPAEGRQAGPTEDFKSMTPEQIRARCAKDPEFRTRYLKWGETAYLERTGRG